ncbi:sugar kinase [bacterium]|nr:sugar kinase [candidate division CSSED10-310 bacterium]
MIRDEGPEVVGIGRTSIDFLGFCDGFPEPDEKKELADFSIQGGGPSATAMVTISRLGMRTAFIGQVGDDYFGRFMLGALEREAVDISAVRIQTGACSQFACIAVDRLTAGRTILWSNGSVSDLPDSNLVEFPSTVRALHMDGHHIEAAAALAAHGRSRGLVVSYDAGSVRPGVKELVKRTDLLITTRRFAQEYTGCRDLTTALFRLHEEGAVIAGITCGPGGSMATAGGEVARVGAFDVPAVDTTGAGDVYHGAFLFGFLRGMELGELVTFANAVAALKCTRLGGRPGIPDYAAASRFIHDHQPGAFREDG